MNDDKSLSATIKSTIYQGERNADTLVFLIPSVYEDKNFADCTLLLRYILPNGVGRSEELEADAELYKDYYQYRLKVSTRLTDVAGNIELWLSAVDFNDNYILKSGTTHIDITPTKKVSDYGTFFNCANLINAPIIPENVTNMACTFYQCYSLVNAPVMSNAKNVTNMQETFAYCTNLVNVPVIPTNVTSVREMFWNCTNLKNAPTIPANVTDMFGTFSDCTNITGNIKITSNRINNTSMQNCFRNTSKTKNVYIPFTGYNSVANTHNAAINSRYGINGKNGVTIYDINTYKG